MFRLPSPINDFSGKPVSIKVRQSKDHSYNILQYSSSEQDDGKFTLITDLEQETVFAYMPPRPSTFLSASSGEFDVRESIEGTMITFFWNGDEWDICSRNGVGCDYSFVRQTFQTDPVPTTFRQMVLDVFGIRRQIETDMSEPMPSAIKDIADLYELDTLSKDYCYTCILQHPENHIVYTLGASLNLIAIYEPFAMPPLISEDSDSLYSKTIREVFNPDEFPHMIEVHFADSDREVWASAKKVFKNTSGSFRTLDNVHSPSKPPPSVSLENHSIPERSMSVGIVQDFKSKIQENFENYILKTNNSPILDIDIEASSNSLYYPPSWIVTEKRTGQRFEIANPHYELAKSLRNMQPNLRYQYLVLQQQGTVGEYLNAFPQYTRIFQILSSEYDAFITNVYAAYVQYYIRKERSEVIPKNHFVHAAKIHHEIYLNPDNQRKKITRETVIRYFAKFAPSKMFYHLTAL